MSSKDQSSKDQSMENNNLAENTSREVLCPSCGKFVGAYERCQIILFQKIYFKG